MAHSVVSPSPPASLRLLNPCSVFSCSNPCSFPDTKTLSLSSNPRQNLIEYQRNARNSSVKAISSDGFGKKERSSRNGIWSIRDDLHTPSSPYFPVHAQWEGAEGPPLMLQERFFSVISQLFEHRIIRCGGEVEDYMANMIVAQLLYLDAVDPKKDIVMYVNSPGGSVTAGMAIYDTMRHIRPDVSTVCVGLAASMGAFILSAGTKGKRFSLPMSRIMIHQPMGEIEDGDLESMEIQWAEILHHKANLSGYLAYHTGQSYEKVTEDTNRDFFMSAEEARDYGLIDGVITNPNDLLSLGAAANL
ncbi:hypothetical protein RHSIM_Rhsim13G0004600 [Rhododendron simsii]|uniref:ATP-dependent Clp protease proteolytic subunit n=1 Tax=Rhododendron simsii TaxID=118357 RepID=A0A834L3H2_RHOSS|nr:hypothetical protein RHSIM_Rhsim13G0004600 [Rhododendron simsii]